MDRNQGRLVEQLRSSQFHQRKVVQQLQADNIRLLSDLVDIRQERDAFRGEAARVRRENAELRNRLEEVLTRCQDLKRERATLVRSATLDSAHVRRPRIINPESRILATLSVLNEGQTESSSSPFAAPTTTVEKAANPKLQPPMYRELPDPLKAASPRPDHAVSTVVTPRSDSKVIPTIQASLSRDYYTS